MTMMARVVAPCVLAWMLWAPASARGGYDIAQIIERTCDPGGPLIVMDAWKRSQDRDKMVTEPGEVIRCERLGSASFQLAAGPDEGGPDGVGLCVYVTLNVGFNDQVGDGADICYVDTTRRFTPLLAVRTSRAGPLALDHMDGQA